MALGGASIGWNNNSPTNSDLVGSGDDEFRSLRSNLQGALDSEHDFPSTGGSTAGAHRLGSARIHVGTASQVSSGDTAGRLMLNTNDYSIWALTPNLVGPVAGQFAIFNNNPSSGVYQAGGAAGSRVANSFQCGISTITSDITTVVSFSGSGYSGVPVVVATPLTKGRGDRWFVSVLTISPTMFGYILVDAGDNIASSGRTVQWMSFGTVASGVA